MKLRSVRKSDLGSLHGHSFGDFLDAVADVDDGRLAGRVEIFLTVGGDDPGTFATNGDGKGFFEVAREKCGRVCGHNEEIVADGEKYDAETPSTQRSTESVVGWRGNSLGIHSRTIRRVWRRR